MINILNNNIVDLKYKLSNEIDKWKERFSKLCNAIDKLLHKEPSDYIEDYEDLADSINYDYYEEDKDNDSFDMQI